MPGGHVTMTNPNGSLYNEYEYPEKGKSVKTGRLYAYVNVAPRDPGTVYPEPVKGIEYYSADEILHALKDMRYYGAEQIVAGIRRQLSVRNDGRYTLEELKRAVRQLDRTSGSYHAELMEGWALQARKNRVWEANGGT